MLEPEDDEEELYALRGALAGTRTPSGAIGCIGLLMSGMMLAIGLSSLDARTPWVGPVFIGFAVIYGLAPGVLAASAMQRPSSIDDNSAAIRQARLLTVFWWLAAAGTASTVMLYALSFLLLGIGR